MKITKKVKVGLVEDWKKAHTWASMWCLSLGASVTGAWALMPEDLKGTLPPYVPKLVGWAAFVLFTLGGVSRVLKNGGDNVEPPK